jgi:hypothetical protein
MCLFVAQHMGRGVGGVAGASSAKTDKTDRQRKRVRQPHNTAEKQRQKAVGQGEYIMNQEFEYAQQQQQQQHFQQQQHLGLHDEVDERFQGYDPMQVGQDEH